MQSNEFVVNLTFRRSPSARYLAAVNLAKDFESYCQQDDEGTLVHSVEVDGELRRHDQFSRFMSLLKLVSGWKGTTVTVGGDVVPTATIDRLVQVGECYQRQRRSGNPYHYCNGFDPRHAPTHFGCRLLGAVNRYVPRNGEQHESDKAWYRHGTMRGDVFEVNKGKVLDLLEDDADSQLAHACPVFSMEAVATEVNSLPDEIDTVKDAKWIATVRPDGTTGVRMRTLADRKHGENGGAQASANAISNGRRNGHGLPAAGDGDAEPEQRIIPDVRFSDVAGQDQAVSDVRDWVELPLLHPELFAHVGVPTQVGVILHGPPGTGKTLLAQAVAGECRAHLETVCGPEILSKWVGQSEENLRRIFDRARHMAPSVVLLDEIDALAPSRDRASHGHEITLVSQLLTLMDGLYDRGQVVVIATTNRLAGVDQALRRPGRFDYAISMVLPDEAGRKAIFERHLRRMAVADDIDVQRLAEQTPGMSGADIAKVCRQAGMLRVKAAIRSGYGSLDVVRVAEDDLTAALDFVGRVRPTGLVNT